MLDAHFFWRLMQDWGCTAENKAHPHNVPKTNITHWGVLIQPLCFHFSFVYPIHAGSKAARKQGKMFMHNYRPDFNSFKFSISEIPTSTLQSTIFSTSKDISCYPSCYIIHHTQITASNSSILTGHLHLPATLGEMEQSLTMHFISVAMKHNQVHEGLNDVGHRWRSLFERELQKMVQMHPLITLLYLMSYHANQRTG